MVRDLLLLARAPLAAGAVDNSLLGMWLAGAWAAGAVGGRPLWVAMLVGLASASLYWAGMVLNDVFDRERDATLQPGRPIPSGRVSAGAAAALGLCLLALGVCAAGLVGAVSGAGLLRGLAAGGLVAGCVLAYDGWLKAFRVPGALAMAACRGTNALLPALACGLPVGPAVSLYAGLLTLYVFGLTYLSTFEDEDAPGLDVAAGHAGCLLPPAAVLLLAATPQGSPWGVPPALALTALVVGQLLATVRRGTRARGGQPTRALLKGIWLLDLAALALLGAWPLLGPWALLYALGAGSARLLFAR